METPAPSKFRVEKRRAQAVLTLSSGQSTRGCFFVGDGCARHTGPERVADVLNAESGFFPFETEEAGVTTTVLLNRRHVLLVALDGDAATSEPAYGLVTRRVVSLLLSNGQRLTGAVLVYRPEGRDRLSDWAQHGERFRYIETAEGTTLVNVDHVVEAREASEA